jgi:membrane protein CcdC involved in cytochrome C biogenesis
VTPTERAISLREFIIDLVIVGCGITMYYAVRNGEIAAVVFFAAFMLLVAAMIANYFIHRGLKKRARDDEAGMDLEC